jgi:hypothetical protein
MVSPAGGLHLGLFPLFGALVSGEGAPSSRTQRRSLEAHAARHGSRAGLAAIRSVGHRADTLVASTRLRLGYRSPEGISVTHQSQVRVMARIMGKVQGVNYRVTAAREARQRGLTGWVRNEPDGAVQREVEVTRQRSMLFSPGAPPARPRRGWRRWRQSRPIPPAMRSSRFCGPSGGDRGGANESSEQSRGAVNLLVVSSCSC